MKLSQRKLLTSHPSYQRTGMHYKLSMTRTKKDLSTNLNKLKLMMDKLKAEDLGFDKTLNTSAMWKRAGKAPCTYIEVFQNSQINMSIFVLKPGFKMPLHDHPHMHGLLKVISGAVKIRSFSESPVKGPKGVTDFVTRAKQEAARLAQGVHKRRRLFAEISNNKVCSAESQTCVLTPTISNYHEIQALDMPAAFFDILSPPYDTLIEGIGPRRCRYYHVVNEISTNVVELQETDVPECFYCDQAPYLGPILG
uniref:2-aminoethanethiol dioxygenase n=1 Tax=Pectinophora gossypiella TaxID=13191 RepID=A0A1E1W058_PECGO